VFEGHIDVDDLERWLNMLEGYFSVHNFFDWANITFALLKSVPYVKNWSETYFEENATQESGMFEAKPTWDFFMDMVKDQYYPIVNYDDHYMRWTTLLQERGQTVSCFTNTFHTLLTKSSIKYTEKHTVLKYRGALHRYIQIEMDFLEILSLGASYRYVFKIKKKFKHHNKWEFRFANMQQSKYVIGNPNSQNNQPQDNQSKL
jgi:hypothetical protein